MTINHNITCVVGEGVGGVAAAALRVAVDDGAIGEGIGDMQECTTFRNFRMSLCFFLSVQIFFFWGGFFFDFFFFLLFFGNDNLNTGDSPDANIWIICFQTHV